MTNLKQKSNIASYSLFIIILSFQISQISSRTFKAVKSYPFRNLVSSDIFGNIDSFEKNITQDGWKLTTIQQSNMKGEPEYFMYMRYYTSEKMFLVKELEENKAHPVIYEDDLIFFSSHIVPIIVFLGKSKKPNIIFKKEIEGLVNIEKMLNKHLKNHPMEFSQEMNFIQFKQLHLSFRNMGYLYTCNQENLNFEIEDDEDGELYLAKTHFQLSNEGSRTIGQIKVHGKSLRKNLDILIEGFISSLTPNDSVEDLANPETESLKTIGIAYDEINVIMNKHFPILGFKGERKKFFLNNLFRLKSIINIGIKKFVSSGFTNFILNPYIFNSPRSYFPGKSQVSVKEFAKKYVEVLLRSLLPSGQMEVKDGSYIQQVQEGMEKIGNIYDKCLNDIEHEYKDSYPTNLREALKTFVRKMNSMENFVPLSTRLKLTQAIEDYVNSMLFNKKFANMKLFSENGKDLHIMVFDTVYHTFGVERGPDDGFAQKVELFYITEDEKDREQNLEMANAEAIEKAKEDADNKSKEKELDEEPEEKTKTEAKEEKKNALI